MSSDRDTIYFVSDAHFGLDDDERERVSRFAAFAGEMRARAESLYILGDLFDFWIEYRRAIRPDYFPVLHILRGLVEAGVKVFYLAGNHDFALGPFLEKTIGMTVCRKSIDAELQGRKVHMRHGDDIHGKSLTGALLRNGSLQSVYKILHPNIGVDIGKRVSIASRKKNTGADIPEADLDKYRQAAQRQIKNNGRDLVILAHTHHAESVKLDGGEYCNTGAWMEHYTYAILRNGKIELRRWDDGGSSL